MTKDSSAKVYLECRARKPLEDKIDFVGNHVNWSPPHNLSDIPARDQDMSCPFLIQTTALRRQTGKP